MKKVYLMLSVIALILFLASSLLLPPITHLEIDQVLSKFPSDWSLVFNTPDHSIFGRTEEHSKAALLEYFEKNRIADQRALQAASLVMLIFSLVGWIREEYIIKHA